MGTIFLRKSSTWRELAKIANIFAQKDDVDINNISKIRPTNGSRSLP